MSDPDTIIFDISDFIEAEPEEMSKKSEELYSLWLDRGNDFVPAVNLRTLDRLPSNVYKLTYNNQEYHITPVKINTDELFLFKNSTIENILKEVDSFWKKDALYKEHKMIHKRGLLLEGPPGCGKTCAISLLIEQLIKRDGLIFLVNTIKEFSLLYENLNSIIRKIEPERPIITIIEDIDKLITNVGDTELLDFMDGKNSVDHHLTILTSNNTTALSPALLRPSRVDMRFKIEAPSKEIRMEYLKSKGISDDVLEEYADKTEGFTLAELKEVFISVKILEKNIDDTITQIKNKPATEDYLSDEDDDKLEI